MSNIEPKKVILKDLTVIQEYDDFKRIFELPSLKLVKEQLPSIKIHSKKDDAYLIEIPKGNKVRVSAIFKLDDIFVDAKKIRFSGMDGFIGVNLSKELIKNCKFIDGDEIECEIELDGALLSVVRRDGHITVGKINDNLFWI